MVDRLSTLQIFQSGISSILQRQAELDRTQQELATGKRILSPADDPSGAVRVLDLREDIARVDQFQRNASIAEGQLALEESTLANVTNALQRVRELTVQANNATQTPQSRAAIGAEIRARLEEVVELANTRDANDEYLFAGFQSQTRPFTVEGGNVTYSGDDGQRFLDIAAGTQVAVRDPGSRVFLDVAAGNGFFDFSAAPGNSGTAVVSATRADSGYVRDDYAIAFSQAAPGAPVTFTVTDGSGGAVTSGSYVSGDTISFNGAEVVIEGNPADGDVINIDSAPRKSVFATIDEIASVLESGSSNTAVNNNDINYAVRKLKRKLQQDGMFRELKNRRHFEKPSERRRRKAREAERRLRKKIRKLNRSG